MFVLNKLTAGQNFSVAITIELRRGATANESWIKLKTAIILPVIISP